MTAFHTIHVLTPCSRRENLPAVKASLDTAAARAAATGAVLALNWHVRFDDKREHVGGWGLRNQILDTTSDTSPAWVWLVDDDTEAHPEILERFAELVTPNIDLFLCAQTRPNGWDPGCADPELLRYGKDVGPGECAFDAGQAIFRRSLLGTYRFVEGDHDSDGYLWRDVLAHVPLDRVAWTPEVLAYYNSLRP